MKFPLRVVYVAGPISAATEEQKAANIDAGRELGRQVWIAGAVALVPHLNALDMVKDGAMTEEAVYLGDLEMLGRCDAMIRVPGWEKSRGVGYETAWARHLRLPVFDSVEELRAWLEGGPPRTEYFDREALDSLKRSLNWAAEHELRSK